MRLSVCMSAEPANLSVRQGASHSGTLQSQSVLPFFLADFIRKSFKLGCLKNGKVTLGRLLWSALLATANT